MEVSLHPTGQTTPHPCSQVGLLAPSCRHEKYGLLTLAAPEVHRPPSLMSCSAPHAMFHGPSAHGAPLAHRLPLLCSASATLAHPPPWPKSSPGLGQHCLCWGPLVWHLLCARHCTGVFLKPHRPRSGGPVISTLRMGNLRLEGGVARSCLRSHRTVKGTAGVCTLGILTLTPLCLLGTPPERGLASSSGPGSTDAPVVP